MFVMTLTFGAKYWAVDKNNNEKRDNKKCLLDTPRRVTVTNKRLISEHKKSEKNLHIYKTTALLRITKENYSNSISP